MKKSKPEIVAALRQIADLLEIADASAYEVMAHRNASRSLDEWNGKLEEHLSVEALRALPSIGKGTSAVILDLANTGKSAVLEQARANVPPELPQLLAISGLGPKRVRALWHELEVESPDDLGKAIEDQRILSLRGFGMKTVERIAAGLDRLKHPRTRRSTERNTNIPVAPAGTGMVWAGTSGYSYSEWKGTFYPEDAKTDSFLRLYSERLRAVEINNTFYRFPSAKVVQSWIEQTPESFRFAIKAHSRITHKLRLGPETESTILDLVARCSELGPRLGCVLFQLPPNFHRNDERLEFLLDKLADGPRYAIEFRHSSWLDDEVLNRLRERNISVVSGDSEGEEPRRFETADFAYVRLRKDRYKKAELDAWDKWIQRQSAAQRDVLLFLKHDEEGMSPEAVLNRWTDSPSKKQLGKRLAKGGPKTKRRSG